MAYKDKDKQREAQRLAQARRRASQDRQQMPEGMTKGMTGQGVTKGVTSEGVTGQGVTPKAPESVRPKFPKAPEKPAGMSDNQWNYIQYRREQALPGDVDYEGVAHDLA